MQLKSYCAQRLLPDQDDASLHGKITVTATLYVQLQALKSELSNKIVR
jgi:hypothetical protein